MLKRSKWIVIILWLCLISWLELSRLRRDSKAVVTRTELPMPYISNRGTCQAYGCQVRKLARNDIIIKALTPQSTGTL